MISYTFTSAFYTVWIFVDATNPSGTRRARDVSWRSPKGPNVWDLQGIFMGLLGDQLKKWWFDEKVFFRCNSLCFTHVLLIFTGKTIIQKLWIVTATGRLRDPVAGHPWDQMIGRFGDVHGTSVIYVFLNSTQKHIKLTLTGYSRLYSELW